ncbi:MAG TPA: IPT/TIG domain-containing protein [Thermomicrobiales bacterium]|jgi:hypothetical protein
MDFIWNGRYWETFPTPSPAPVIASVEPNTLPTNSGPQQVTIDGLNLCGLSVLTIDADAVDYTVPFTRSNGLLVFDVPAGVTNIAGAGMFTVRAGSTGGDIVEIGSIWRGQPAQPTVAPTAGVLRQYPPLPVTAGMWQRSAAGVGLLAPPADIAAANTGAIPGLLEDGASSTGVAWPTGTYIVFGDASEGHWNGTTWVAGRAP